VKDYEMVVLEMDTQLSVKTINRRLQALQSLGWIDIKGPNIYLRSLKKICKSVDCRYNDNKPKKKKHQSSKIYTIKELLRAESLREHISAQETKALRKASKKSTKYLKSFGIKGLKAWLLNSPEELQEHSQFFRSLEVTASREKCAEIWGCSLIDASRSLNALARHRVISDRKRAGMIYKGDEQRAAALRRVYDDPTIFHKKGKIYKKLNNLITFLKVDVEKHQYVPDSKFYQGGDDYDSRFLFKLDMMYTSYLSKFSLGIKCS
tara:strand:- start:2707 stop:3498 length:792 start_codon:yes stop_codon:yes gene_type:complete